MVHVPVHECRVCRALLLRSTDWTTKERGESIVPVHDSWINLYVPVAAMCANSKGKFVGGRTGAGPDLLRGRWIFLDRVSFSAHSLSYNVRPSFDIMKNTLLVVKSKTMQSSLSWLMIGITCGSLYYLYNSPLHTAGQVLVHVS